MLTRGANYVPLQVRSELESGSIGTDIAPAGETEGSAPKNRKERRQEKRTSEADKKKEKEEKRVENKQVALRSRMAKGVYNTLFHRCDLHEALADTLSYTQTLRGFLPCSCVLNGVA